MICAVGSKKNIMELPYYSCISDIFESEEVQKLGGITHHIYTTRLQHSLNVSYYNYVICNFLGLDAVSAARAGLMHDLFYYNRKEHKKDKTNGKKSHSAYHPEIAAENAREAFDISLLERDIIIKHMWPLTLKLPKYKESYVIVLVDKYCAILELISPKYQKIKKILMHNSKHNG
ncbi:HD domain-containing protein [Porcipelethomonas sp.]|uniref:HD domain-containing protein n=1 Tax=Porcipelethomonas sp. TaxID=2981675 RepID=UPI003EF5722D